jgi:hypothetical protein
LGKVVAEGTKGQQAFQTTLFEMDLSQDSMSTIIRITLLSFVVWKIQTLGRTELEDTM